MEMEIKSYGHGLRSKEGSYIHRHYLPKQFRDELQPEDITVLYDKILSDYWDKSLEEIHANMLDGPCSIRYRAERLTKEIPCDLLKAAIDACVQYSRDDSDYSLTAVETDFLIALNDRLRKLEDDIDSGCYRLNQEMQKRQKQSEPFLNDFEIKVMRRYQLRDSHLLYRDDDDNFIYEVQHWRTFSHDDQMEEKNMQGCEHEEMDWNNAYSATNPQILNNPLFNMPNCWLFHELQSHSRVPLKHLCNIGTILVEITVSKLGTVELAKEVLKA